MKGLRSVTGMKRDDTDAIQTGKIGAMLIFSRLKVTAEEWPYLCEATGERFTDA